MSKRVTGTVTDDPEYIIEHIHKLELMSDGNIICQACQTIWKVESKSHIVTPQSKEGE